MSIQVITDLRLEVRNVDEETQKILVGVYDYLQQINHMINLESIYIYYLHISVDGMEVIERNISDIEAGNTYYINREGHMGQKHVEHELWQKYTELDKTINMIPNANDLVLEMSSEIMSLLGEPYGNEYFLELFETIKRNESETINYKGIEYYDTDPEIWCCSFPGRDNSPKYVSYDYTKSIDEISDILSWYTYNLCFSFEFNEELPKEFYKLIADGVDYYTDIDSFNLDFSYTSVEEIQNMNELINKETGSELNTNEICDIESWDNEFDDTGEVMIEGSGTLNRKEICFLRRYIEKIYNKIKDGEHYYNFSLDAEFLADEEENAIRHKWAALKILVENDSIVVKSIRY